MLLYPVTRFLIITNDPLTGCHRAFDHRTGRRSSRRQTGCRCCTAQCGNNRATARLDSGACRVPVLEREFTGAASTLQTLSRDCNINGQIDPGESLNTNENDPDEYTIFNTVAAWVPVSIISNRGTGMDRIKFTEAQYLLSEMPVE